MTAEEWRPVVGGEGWYEVSDQGRIRNVRAGKGRRVGWVIRPSLMSRKLYYKVDLRIAGQRVTIPVHRVVGTAFYGELPEGLQTRHLNGNSLDNRLVNLKYGTHLENMHDAIAHGTHVSLRVKARTHCSAGHEYTPENTAMSPDGIRLCRRCGIDRCLAYQERVLVRRESAGEVTERLVREWAVANGFANEGAGRLSNAAKLAYAEAHPEKDWTPEPAVRTAPPRRGPRKAPTHGTDGMYTNHGCRCDECREAHNAAGRLRRGRRRQLVEAHLALADREAAA